MSSLHLCLCSALPHQHQSAELVMCLSLHEQPCLCPEQFGIGVETHWPRVSQLSGFSNSSSSVVFISVVLRWCRPGDSVYTSVSSCPHVDCGQSTDRPQGQTRPCNKVNTRLSVFTSVSGQWTWRGGCCCCSEEQSSAHLSSNTLQQPCSQSKFTNFDCDLLPLLGFTGITILSCSVSRNR